MIGAETGDRGAGAGDAALKERPPAEATLVTLDDLSGNGCAHLVPAKGGDGLGLATQIEAPRKIQQQILDGIDSELGELVCARRADPLYVLHRRVSFYLAQVPPR